MSIIISEIFDDIKREKEQSVPKIKINPIVRPEEYFKGPGPKIADRYPTKVLAKELWPEDFRHLRNKPKNLWIRGSPLWAPDDISKRPKLICVVGSRKGTKYGYDACKILLAGLYKKPVAIVSGLAYGIDAEAHKTALALNLPCIALPGSGIDDESIYPREHHRLAADILSGGGTLLSELPCGTKADKWTFPQRNRLMAAMSDLIIVVEAGERSGTFITALQGLDIGKTIGAVPGPIDSPLSRGPHTLLRDGAFPITSAKDILELVGLA